MDDIAKRDFEQLNITHKGTIPTTIKEGKIIFDALGDYTNTSDWYRSAFVNTWVQPTSGGRPKSDENSPLLNITDFANLKIRGLSSRNAVRHYLEAWGKRIKPIPGEIITLPTDPFPEWGTLKTSDNLFTGDDEWYTPDKYIEKAKNVMGSIDLDPATNEDAQKIIKAAIYYTKETNGLDKTWQGNVWMNPPYSGKLISAFIDKIVSESQITQAIVLTNNNTDTQWFLQLFNWSNILCFTTGRIRFYKSDGSLSSQLYGQVFFYKGDNIDKFIDEFNDVGLIMKKINYE